MEVVAQENQIDIRDKHCQISNIIVDEVTLQSRLSKVGTLEMINADIKYTSINNCGIPIYEYSIETSDKNIVDIIGGYAYSKKAGTATLTIIPNSIVNDSNLKKEIQITVEQN